MLLSAAPMNRFVPAALLIVACTDPPPFVGVDVDSDRVERVTLTFRGPRQLDLLFVIDGSLAMQPYAEALAANAPAFIHTLESIQGALPSVHLAVTTAAGDGTLRTATPINGAYISDVPGESGTRVRNYTGSLADAFGRLAAVGTDGPAVRMPLAAAAHVLEQDSAFLRPDAQLHVTIIASGDDQSPDSLAAYAAAFRAAKLDPKRVSIGVVAPPSAVRLRALADAFPDRASVSVIDQPDWTSALQQLAGDISVHPNDPCFTSVVTSECRATSSAYGVIRDCEYGMPPCYTIAVDPVSCTLAPHRLVRFEVDPSLLPEWSTFQIECVVDPRTY